MGNCYGQPAEYSNEDIKLHLRLSKVDNHKNIKTDFENNLSDVGQENMEEEFITPLLQALPESYIQSLIKDLNEKMNNFEIIKKNKILKKNLKALDTPFELYFKQESIQETETSKKRRIHNLFARMASILTPQASMIYDMNSKEELMTKIDDNLQEYKVIRSDRSEDSNTIIQIILMTTKKFLIVKSKSFLTMRIYRRLSESEYVIVGESILRNDLNKQSDLKKIRSEMFNECEVFLTGSKYGNIEGGFSNCNFTRGDFKTSTGNMILKPIFKKTFNTYNTTNIKEFVNFILKDHQKLIWFDQDEEEIKKVLNAQRQVLLDYSVEIPEMFSKEWTERLNELKDEINEFNKKNNENKNNQEEDNMEEKDENVEEIEEEIEIIHISNKEPEETEETKERELGDNVYEEVLYGNDMTDQLIEEVEKSEVKGEIIEDQENKGNDRTLPKE